MNASVILIPFATNGSLAFGKSPECLPGRFLSGDFFAGFQA